MFNWVFNRFYFLSRVLHQSRDSRSDVSLGSQCGCHLIFFSKLCMRVIDKKVNYDGLLCCRDL